MNTYVFWLFRGAGVVMADAPCMHQSYCAVLCKKVAMLWQDTALCEHSHSGRESVELCGGVLLKRVLEKNFKCLLVLLSVFACCCCLRQICYGKASPLGV